jgi:phosphoserine phosphatase
MTGTMASTPDEYPRIVFLAMDGTLLLKKYRLDEGKAAPSAWTVLAEALVSGGHNA